MEILLFVGLVTMFLLGAIWATRPAPLAGVQLARSQARIPRSGPRS